MTPTGLPLYEVSAGLCLAWALLMLSLGLSPVVFGPLLLVPPDPAQRTRFQIVDVLLLMAELQIVAAAGFLLIGDASLRTWLVTTLGTVACAWWGITVVWLARRNVAAVRTRCWMLGVIAPLGFAALALSPALVLPVVMLLWLLPSLAFFEPSVKEMWPGAVGLLLGLLDLLAIAWCRRECWKLARNLTRAATTEQTSPGAAETSFPLPPG